jgi:hypothetical protein
VFYFNGTDWTRGDSDGTFYTKADLMLGIALKTISNYLDYISPTPIDYALAGESKGLIPFPEE